MKDFLTIAPIINIVGVGPCRRYALSECSCFTVVFQLVSNTIYTTWFYCVPNVVIPSSSNALSLSHDCPDVTSLYTLESLGI